MNSKLSRGCIVAHHSLRSIIIQDEIIVTVPFACFSGRVDADMEGGWGVEGGTGDYMAGEVVTLSNLVH